MQSAVEPWCGLDQREHALSLGLASMKALLGGSWYDGDPVKKETGHWEGQDPKSCVNGKENVGLVHG